MKKYIDGNLQEVISETKHNKNCTCDNFIEFTKSDLEKSILIVKYKYCPDCGQYLTGRKYSFLNEHY